tara:strand:- start:3791 stop:3982 length:192 start_codon:yes stop_codon:yes gene_type:complete
MNTTNNSDSNVNLTSDLAPLAQYILSLELGAERDECMAELQEALNADSETLIDDLALEYIAGY